jgi:hypothetical protein
MNAPAPREPFRRLNDLWWLRLPAAAGRVSRSAGGILGDGLYTSAAPALSAAMPPVLLALGVLIGWRHPAFAREEIFTASLLVTAVMLAVGTMSTGWGAWLWLGYAAGDFVLYPHAAYLRLQGNVADQLLRGRLPLLIVYVLLAGLVLYAPLTSRFLRVGSLTRLRGGGAAATWTRALLQGAIHGALVFTWTQAAPTLLRPVYTWQGDVPTQAVMNPLQARGVVLALLGAAFAIARVVLESRAVRAPGAARRAMERQRAFAKAALAPARGLPVWLRVPLRTAFTTFMLAGVLATWFDAVVFAAVVAVIMTMRETMIPRMGAWTALVGKVPLLARLAAGVALGWLLTTWIIGALWDVTQTFRPIMITVAINLVIFLLLIPDAATRLRPRPAPTPARPRSSEDVR